MLYDAWSEERFLTELVVKTVWTWDWNSEAPVDTYNSCCICLHCIPKQRVQTYPIELLYIPSPPKKKKKKKIKFQDPKLFKIPFPGMFVSLFFLSLWHSRILLQKQTLNCTPRTKVLPFFTTKSRYPVSRTECLPPHSTAEDQIFPSVTGLTYCHKHEMFLQHRSKPSSPDWTLLHHKMDNLISWLSLSSSGKKGKVPFSELWRYGYLHSRA